MTNTEMELEGTDKLNKNVSTWGSSIINREV